MKGFVVRVEPEGEVLVMHPAATTVAAKTLVSNTNKILLLSVLIYDAVDLRPIPPVPNQVGPSLPRLRIAVLI